MRNIFNSAAPNARSMAGAAPIGALLLAGGVLAGEMEIIMLSDEAPAAAGVPELSPVRCEDGLDLV